MRYAFIVSSVWFIAHCMFARNRRSEIKSRVMDYSSHDSPYRTDVKSMEWERLVEKHGEEYSPDLANTLMI